MMEDAGEPSCFFFSLFPFFCSRERWMWPVRDGEGVTACRAVVLQAHLSAPKSGGREGREMTYDNHHTSHRLAFLW
jgi:hypothetical protein